MSVLNETLCKAYSFELHKIRPSTFCLFICAPKISEWSVGKTKINREREIGTSLRRIVIGNREK